MLAHTVSTNNHMIAPIHIPSKAPRPQSTTPPRPGSALAEALLHRLVLGLLLLMAGPTHAQVSPCLQIQCPDDVVVACAGETGTTVRFEPTVTTQCGSRVSTNCTPPSGSIFSRGITTVTCTASDALRNSARCSFTVTVHDSQPPDIVATGGLIAPCSSITGAVVRYTIVARDRCDSAPQLTCTPPSGSLFPIGTNHVSCTAVDAAGNSRTASFPVIVTDECTACLELTCPTGMVEAVAGADGIAPVAFSITATNRCGGDVWVRCEPPTDHAFPMGVTAVNCSAGIGTATTPLQRCTFQVRVKDTLPPSIQISRAAMTVVCQGILVGTQAGAYVDFDQVKAVDNVDPAPTLTFTPPSGSYFPIGVHSITALASDSSGNESIRRFSLTVVSGWACEIHPEGVLDPTENWSFELGLRTWTRNGAAFNSQPTVGDNIQVHRIPELVQQIEDAIGGDYWRDLSYPIGQRGTHWIGTAENHPDDTTPQGTMQGDSLTGTLMSKPFGIQQPYITFLIGGGSDLNRLRVELLVKAEPDAPGAIQTAHGWFRVVIATTGHGHERMRRESFNAQAYVGQLGRLRIVDQSESGHLNVDDFRFQPLAPAATTVTVGNLTRPSVVDFDGRQYDWDSPVWGLADLHTHPMSHLGMGRKVFHGEPDGLVQNALSDCNCNHGGPGVDNGCGNMLRKLVISGFDGENTVDPHREGLEDVGDNLWTRFSRWPVFTSISHQQMWFEWVRRAYDGGLRVMVALTVHNKLLAGATVDSVKPYDDVSVMHSQINELKLFVARHADFMEIAYDPFDLRRIVRENKLAIIIGSETDDIGNYGTNPAIKEPADLVSKEVVRERLKDLYNLGLRYIFPVHLTDNKFGGAAVYNSVFPIATKYYTGKPTAIEPAGNGIKYRLPNLDGLTHLPSSSQILGATLDLLRPDAPIELILDAGKAITAGKFGQSDSSLGMAGVAAVATLPMIMTTPAAAAAGPALIGFFGDFASLELPDDVLPLGDNYPNYDLINLPGVMEGHRNTKGLTPLGEFAIQEMMKLGMIVDLDHMGEKGVMRALDLAEEVPGGYPMNFGHNSFRAQRFDGSENNRTPEQLERVRDLGGLMGLGWGNGDRRSADEALVLARTNTTSYVKNNNPGSSKSFAQAALYALEFFTNGQVALGTDINGYVVGPGPRFGPQGAFGTREEFEALKKRSANIKAQFNGVAYAPREGRPGTTGVFNGRAVDQDEDDHAADVLKGFAYNKQQRDFFVALRIFRWGWQRSPKLTHDEVEPITEGLHDSYDRDRVKELVRGLLIGPTNGDPGTDTDPDVVVKQMLAKATYRKKVLGENPPSDITNDQTRLRRYHNFLKVWDDYDGIYGTNTPMKRCTTQLVQWDYNFDGLAHYGLMPDFFQDLKNVGLNNVDLSPLFRSADDFARMWTKCLVGADAINHPKMFIPLDPEVARNLLKLEWYGSGDDQVEEADSLTGPWRPSNARLETTNNRVRATFPTDRNTPARFFRVRK